MSKEQEGMSKEDLLATLADLPDSDDSDTEGKSEITGDPLAKQDRPAIKYDYLSGAKIACLFSAHAESVVVPFMIGEHECSVTLRQMNADQMAKYRDLIAKFATKEGKDGDDTKFYYEPDTALADLAILMGTVRTMTLYFDAPVKKGGKETVKTQYPFPEEAPTRIKLFREMVPELRAKLVNECKRVNGLHPLDREAEASGTQT